MKIDRTLKLVLEAEQDDGTKLYVHHTPISLDVFEENASLFARTMALIYGQGIGYKLAPRFAAPMLKQAAMDLGGEDGGPILYRRILGEFHRLTSVVVPFKAGWDTILFPEAISRGLLDEESLSEINSAIVFFSLGWRTHTKTERQAILGSAMSIWGGLMSSLNPTEYVASLQTSIVAESSGEKPKAAASYVPS